MTKLKEIMEAKRLEFARITIRIFPLNDDSDECVAYVHQLLRNHNYLYCHEVGCFVHNDPGQYRNLKDADQIGRLAYSKFPLSCIDVSVSYAKAMEIEGGMDWLSYVTDVRAAGAENDAAFFYHDHSEDDAA